MLESALFRLLDGRCLSGETMSVTSRNLDSEIISKFWSQLQMILKNMLAVALSQSTNRSSPAPQPSVPLNKFQDVGKLRELYKMSLQSTDLNQLHAMHKLLTS